MIGSWHYITRFPAYACYFKLMLVINLQLDGSIFYGNNTFDIAKKKKKCKKIHQNSFWKCE